MGIVIDFHLIRQIDSAPTFAGRKTADVGAFGEAIEIVQVSFG
jgi:hypothetical protein